MFYSEYNCIFVTKKMKFSIITINYNNCDGLSRTIESVIGQTYNDYEFIVIDGGSQDGSVNLLKANDKAISYWVSEQDNGIYQAMNKGVTHAHGDYCFFLNSGDFFYDSSVLERVQNYINGEDIVVGSVMSKENDVAVFAPPARDISLYHLYSSTVPHQGAFIKVELQKKYPYDEDLKIVSDWKFFLQSIIMGNCSIKYIDEYIAYFDLNGISTTNPDKMWKEKERVLKDFFPYRVLLDYKLMKSSECLTQILTPQLKRKYRVDQFLYFIGKMLLKLWR